MNFVYANVGVNKSSVKLNFGNDQIDYKGDKLEKLKTFENKEIVMGIRPEAFEDGNYANTSEYSESIKVSVSLLEQLGSDSYIHFYKDIKPVQTEAIEEILADEGEDISVLGDGHGKNSERLSHYVCENLYTGFNEIPIENLLKNRKFNLIQFEIKF